MIARQGRRGEHHGDHSELFATPATGHAGGHKTCDALTAHLTGKAPMADADAAAALETIQRGHESPRNRAVKGAERGPAPVVQGWARRLLDK